MYVHYEYNGEVKIDETLEVDFDTACAFLAMTHRFYGSKGTGSVTAPDGTTYNL